MTATATTPSQFENHELAPGYEYSEIRYELRAEVPGRFAALPVMGHAMYVPEIRCNGGEISIEVVD